MKLSVVIPTKNEEANVGTCIDAFAAFRDDVELIVVDNSSPDRTREIAGAKGAKVLVQGPERCAQRNRGWREATGDYVMFVDADMIVPAETIREIIEYSNNRITECKAFWIPEVRTGTGFRVKARNFERSFYDGTCIDALRLFHRSVLEKTGGYDENLIAGPEDWELDIRVLATGAKCAVLKNHLIHNEKQLTLKRMLEKKAYYSKSMAAYQAKWRGHPALRKQFGLYYRFLGVFIENGKWRRLIRHPILAFVMYFERFAVGLTYLINR